MELPEEEKGKGKGVEKGERKRRESPIRVV